MAWSLEDLRNRLRIVLALPSSAAVPDDILNTYINEALRYTMPMTLLPNALQTFFSMTTLPGTGEYGIDLDMLTIMAPLYVDREEIAMIYDNKRFFDYVGDRYEKSYGRPQLALYFGGQIWFDPVPDDEYEVRVVAISRPAKLENNSDTISKSSWGLPIVYSAAYKYTMDRGDTDTAAIAAQRWQEEKEIAQRDALVEYSGRRIQPNY